MYSVSTNLVFDYFGNEIKALSQSLIQHKSVMMVCYNLKYDFLVNFLEHDSKFRESFFKRKKDDFTFIKIESEFVLLNTESDFLLYLSATFGRDFECFEDLNNYLNDKEKIAVFYSEDFDIEFQKKLFSYKYYLGSRALFIFNSENNKVFSDEFTKIEISGSVLEELVLKRITALNIEVNTLEVLRNLNGDIALIDEAIIKTLYFSKNKEKASPEIELLSETPVILTENNPINSSEDTQVVDLRKDEEKYPALTDETHTPNIEVVKEESTKTEVITTEVKNSNNNQPELTPREEKIYEILKEKNFLSRKDLSRIVWGKNWKEKGNDNAIDKVISRLRSKFVKAGFNKTYVTSKKGEGISLQED